MGSACSPASTSLVRKRSNARTVLAARAWTKRASRTAAMTRSVPITSTARSSNASRTPAPRPSAPRTNVSQGACAVEANAALLARPTTSARGSTPRFASVSPSRVKTSAFGAARCSPSVSSTSIVGLATSASMAAVSTLRRRNDMKLRRRNDMKLWRRPDGMLRPSPDGIGPRRFRRG